MTQETGAEHLVEVITRFRADVDRTRARAPLPRNTRTEHEPRDAQGFAQRLGLGASLCGLLREFATYPGTRGSGFGERYESLGFALLAAARTRLQDRACNVMELLRIRFSLDQKSYTFEFHKYWPLYIDGGPEYYQAGEIRVLEDEQVVCAYNVAQHPTNAQADDYAYTPLRPTTLKMGDWIPAVIELDELARAHGLRQPAGYQDKVLYIDAFQETQPAESFEREDR